MLLAWVLFPVLLVALSLGCGLLLERCVGRPLLGPLVAPVGFAVLVVLIGVVTSRGETASLVTPIVVLAALAGAVLTYPSWRTRAGALDRWAVGAALAAFAVYAAPVVFSGDPTFAGYIKLDDTATWMAFVDQVVDHGRNLSRLELSSYQTTLEVNIPPGYPVGAFLPLGIGGKLTGTDVAWLVQPYMATMAGLLALCLYRFAQPLVESRPLRALVAFGASQSALLFGYSLWGGIKEVAVALAIAVLAATVPAVLRRGASWRDTLPAAVATTALLEMVGTGGFAWLGPILGLAAIAVWRAASLRRLFDLAWPLALTAAILSVPPFFAADTFSLDQGGLTDPNELGNLIGPLSVWQFVGIWPTGDFRLDPGNMGITTLLIAVAVGAAIAGVVLAWRRRAWEPLLYVAGAGIGSIAIYVYSSPWVDAKALASGSPALLLFALAAAAALATRVERVLGTTLLVLLLGGVLWSNALAYHDVSLAPYDQLRELESIGEEFAGEGPTLMTEYQPYGVRHFLRDADAEGASELRARPVPLVEGGELEKGEWGDTDQISLPSLLTYRTLVLRRNPGQSRPPSVYELVRSGEYYEVWQRPPDAPEAIGEHLPLGDFEEPAASPSCGEVLRLAGLAGPDGTLAAVERGPNASASLSASARPADWIPTEADSPDVVPNGPGIAELQLDLPRGGRFSVYIQGSTRNLLSVEIDGNEVGSVSKQLNESRQFLYFGDAALNPGLHDVRIELEGQSLAPGSGGPPEPIGPLVLSPTANEDPPILEVPASEARSLCGKHLDWIEASTAR